MKKNHLIYAAAAALTLGFGFTACGDDDPAEKVEKNPQIVTTNVPSTLGWSQNDSEGIAYYTVTNDADLEDGEYNSYFGFAIKGDKVKAAVFSLVTGSEAEAATIAKLFNNGTWISEEDEADLKAPARKVAGALGRNLRAAVKKVANTRANMLLPIPVLVSGKVIYINIPQLEGLSVAEVKNVMLYWNTDANIDADKFIFGKWDEKKGTYTCTNMGGVNITYVVNVEFNSNEYCTKYLTTVTCPNPSWAQVMYSSLEDQCDTFEDMFGRRPVLSITGNVVSVDAAIINDVKKESIENALMQLDWINNMPMLYLMAE